MKSSETKISISVESYDEKTAENDRNSYVEKDLNEGFFSSFILSEK